MNKQEVFDTVVNHLRQQGKKAFDQRLGRCLYRTEDGLKCAVGCLIPDNEYSRMMENRSHLNVDSPTLQKIIDQGNYELLISLQRVHDALNAQEWEQGFQRVATRFGLKYLAPEAT